MDDGAFALARVRCCLKLASLVLGPFFLVVLLTLFHATNSEL
jgi:hypothetical protein